MTTRNEEMRLDYPPPDAALQRHLVEQNTALRWPRNESGEDPDADRMDALRAREAEVLLENLRDLVESPLTLLRLAATYCNHKLTREGERTLAEEPDEEFGNLVKDAETGELKPNAKSEGGACLAKVREVLALLKEPGEMVEGDNGPEPQDDDLGWFYEGWAGGC